jgi:hypothetical protein
LAELEIYVDGKRVAKTSRAFAASTTKELMRAYTMSATLFNTDAARKYIQPGAVLKMGGQMYDLSGYKQNSGTNNVTQIDGRHVGYRLNNYSVPQNYAFVGTSRQIAQDLLNIAVDANGKKANTEFSIGDCADVGLQSFMLGNDQPCTLRSAVLAIKAIGVEVDFDNFTLNFPQKCGTGNAKTFKFGRDLCNIDRTWDIDNGMTYDVAIANLQRIPGHEADVFDVGDEVTIADDFIGDAITRRIISYTKCFDDPSQDKITLGVFVRTSIDQSIAMKLDLNSAKTLAEGSVQVGTAYNGVAISHEKGFESISGDGLTRKFDNGTDGYIIQQYYNSNWVTVYEACKSGSQGKVTVYNLDHTQKVVMGGSLGIATYSSTDGTTWIQTGGQDANGLNIATKITSSTNPWAYGIIGDSAEAGLCLYINGFTTNDNFCKIVPIGVGQNNETGTFIESTYAIQFGIVGDRIEGWIDTDGYHGPIDKNYLGGLTGDYHLKGADGYSDVVLHFTNGVATV